MGNGRLGVTESGIPYDRTDGLEVRLTAGEIHQLLRACATAMNAEPRGPASSETDEDECFCVAMAKLEDASGLGPWHSMRPWYDLPCALETWRKPKTTKKGV